MMALVGSVLLASLLGSPHCAGMCGGFVAFYSGGDGRGRIGPHLAYNGGRLLSYVTLGAIAGWMGAGLDHVAGLAGLGRLAAVLAGVLMVAWGGGTLLAGAGVKLPLPAVPLSVRRALAAALRAVHAQPAHVRALVMGLVTTLLPCGWLYAFVTLAGGTAQPLAGAAVMALFWLGTLPVMAGLGLAAQSAFGPLRRRLPALTAVLLVVFGLLTVAGKFRPMPAMHHAMPGMTMPAPGASSGDHEHAHHD
jgi:sulfite exporter TauE/SafE